MRDTLLAMFPEQSGRFEAAAAGLAQLEQQLGPLPNLDPAASCPANGGPTTGGGGGGNSCPELWSPDGLCRPGDVHAPCQYTVSGRKLSCGCCYPQRLTWQCGFR